MTSETEGDCRRYRRGAPKPEVKAQLPTVSGATRGRLMTVSRTDAHFP